MRCAPRKRSPAKFLDDCTKSGFVCDSKHGNEKTKYLEHLCGINFGQNKYLEFHGSFQPIQTFCLCVAGGWYIN